MAFVQIGPSVYDGTMQSMEEFDARQLLAMAAAFKHDTGETLRWGDALRTDAEQEVIFGQRYVRVTYRTGIYYKGAYWVKLPGVPVAAIPGKSNHRLGIAIDFYMTPKLRAWLPVNGPKYGFTNTQGKASGEEWHWVRDKAPTIVAAASSTTHITAEPEETQELIMATQIIRSKFDKGDFIVREDGAIAFFPGFDHGNEASRRLGIRSPEALDAEALTFDAMTNRTLTALGAVEKKTLLDNPKTWYKPIAAR